MVYLPYNIQPRHSAPASPSNEFISCLHLCNVPTLVRRQCAITAPHMNLLEMWLCIDTYIWLAKKCRIVLKRCELRPLFRLCLVSRVLVKCKTIPLGWVMYGVAAHIDYEQRRGRSFLYSPRCAMQLPPIRPHSFDCRELPDHRNHLIRDYPFS